MVDFFGGRCGARRSRGSRVGLVLLHKFEINLGAEDVVIFLGIAGEEGLGVFREEGDELGGRGGAAVEEGVADGDAVGADRLLAEAEAVAGAAIDGDLAFGSQGLAEKELLFFEGVFGAHHGKADARLADDLDGVAGFERLDETLERGEIALAKDGIVIG